MNGLEHYILVKGKPKAVPLMRWAKWMETADRVVEQTDVGEVWVSTVFLGINYGFGPNTQPLLFETMVFPQGSFNDLHVCRHTTIGEAKRHHWEVVEKMRAGIKPEDL